MFFPDSIDHLNKEDSNRDGIKPILVDPLPEKHLKRLFFGAYMS